MSAELGLLRRRRTRRPAGTWLRSAHWSPAGGRAYALYVPDVVEPDREVPLLVLLHGCGQRPEVFGAATRFTALADRHGFLVLVPEQTALHHPQRCWQWYRTAHQGHGRGEPAILAAMTAAVMGEQQRYRVDRRRVYVAGMSAGGGMALVLGSAYPEVFAAVATHSAPAYRSASGHANARLAMAGRTAMPRVRPWEGPMPPLIAVQGGRDDVVVPAHATWIVEHWLARRAAADVRGGRERIARRRLRRVRVLGGRRCAVSRWYAASGHIRLEMWLVAGLGHAWSGGTRHTDDEYTDPSGPRAATLMWRFLRKQRLPAG